MAKIHSLENLWSKETFDIFFRKDRVPKLQKKHNGILNLAGKIEPELDVFGDALRKFVQYKT